eukprot:732395-Rhodomonas_salina.1
MREHRGSGRKMRERVRKRERARERERLADSNSVEAYHHSFWFNRPRRLPRCYDLTRHQKQQHCTA